MSPRHFSNLRKSDPVAYNKGQDQVWNTFVSITHKIGLSNYFSFVPPVLKDGIEKDTNSNPPNNQ
jgi:hypothetical protein